VATVTGLTAARMQEIVDASVESGYINGSNHLILVLHDTTEIDAGTLTLPSASTTVPGIVELATDAETITGTDTVRAVTPASLAAASTTLVPAASDTVAGRVELATNAETITGTDTVRAVTPAGFAAAFDSRLGTKGLDALSDVIITSAAIGHILQHDGSTFVNKSTIDQVVAATGTDAHTVKVTGDSQLRLVINGDGSIEWGSGSAALNIKLYRYADNILGLDDGLMMTDSTKQLNIGNSGSSAAISVKMAASGDGVLTTRVGSDADSRFFLEASGDLYWGDGTATQDTQLTRYDVASLRLVGGTFRSDMFFAQVATAGTDFVYANVTGDSSARLTIQADGQHNWGDGAGGNAVNLYRSTARLATDNNFAINAVGKGLQVKEGSNAKMGTAVLVGGTLVVNTTAVTASSRIFLTCNTPGGTPGFLRVSARTAGTSFTILSSSGTDTSTVAWFIVEPA